MWKCHHSHNVSIVGAWCQYQQPVIVWKSCVWGFQKSVTQIAVLRHVKKMLPFEIRRDLYLSFIVAHFNYCSKMLHFCSKGATNKLEKIHERVIRFVFRDKHTNNYEELLQQLGLSTLQNQRLMKIATSVFKVMYSNNAPLLMINFLILLYFIHFLSRIPVN